MLDQMFTADNFRRVFDRENRKGSDLVTRFFPHLEPQTLTIRDKVKQLREHRSKETALSPEAFSQKTDELKAELAALKAAKSSSIDAEMDKISTNVMRPSFKISLEKRTGPKGKSVYCIDSTAESFFVVKQLQANLNTIYGVKQSNRHDLACQVRDSLNGNFPFEMVRTDIASFYESVDRRELLAKLDQDHLLSASSKRFIKQILDSYESAAEQIKGIPRGVGISAYLAELYLRPLDREISSIDGIVLYCRYVDDIVTIFARRPTGKPLKSYQEIIADLFSKHSLPQNAHKTKSMDLAVNGIHEFEYLGYQFRVTIGRCEISPSVAKMEKYRERLNKSFAAYKAESSVNSRRAYRTLVARVKFLTGNTRLANSKSSAVTGIYYNNSIVTNLDSFTELDQQLKLLVQDVRRPRLRERLKRYKFTEGFLQRRFHNFTAKELYEIVRAWKHG